MTPRDIEHAVRVRDFFELSGPHRFQIVGENIRNGVPVSRDPVTGELWSLYADGTSTATITELVAFDNSDRDCAA